MDRWPPLARERGLTVMQEPTSYPWGHRVMRLADPDGMVVSLFSRSKHKIAFDLGSLSI